MCFIQASHGISTQYTCSQKAGPGCQGPVEAEGGGVICPTAGDWALWQAPLPKFCAISIKKMALSTLPDFWLNGCAPILLSALIPVPASCSQPGSPWLLSEQQGSRGNAFVGTETLWPAWGSRREAELGSDGMRGVSPPGTAGPGPAVLLGVRDKL